MMANVCTEVVEVGASCDPSNDCCARGSECAATNDEGTEGQCYRGCEIPEEGDSVGCEARELCLEVGEVGEDGITPGLCIPGDDCEPGNESLACGEGDFVCNRRSNISQCIDLAEAETEGFTVVGEGEACLSSDTNPTICESGLVCESNGTGGVCRRACSDDSSCEEGDTCLDYSNAVDGVNYKFCAPVCDLANPDCGENGACVITDILDDVAYGTCREVPAEDLAAAGDACNIFDSDQALKFCSAGNSCEFNGVSYSCVSVCNDMIMCGDGETCVDATERYNESFQYNFCTTLCDPLAQDCVSGGGEDANGNGMLDTEDTNGNGVLDTEDANGNGVLDTGEDANDNGVLDTEDANGNGELDTEDANGNGELDTEDANGNGELDTEDTNGNGVLDIEDANGNGVLDDGEDANGNGVLDTEDANGNGVLDTEDANGNGVLDTEDTNGNGVLDTEDTNGNGVLDTEDANGNGMLDDSEDTNGNGVLDTEDANGNGELDTEDANGNGELDAAVQACAFSGVVDGVPVGTCIESPAPGTGQNTDDCTRSATDPTYWGDCAANNVCFIDDEATGAGSCGSFCGEGRSDLCTGENQACVDSAVDGLGLCSGACNIYSDVGCEMGESCLFSNEGNNAAGDLAATGFCEENPNKGQVGTEEACVMGMLDIGDGESFEYPFLNNCPEGHVCIGVAQGQPPICLQMCDQAAAENTCPAGLTCQGLFQSIETVGVCFQ